jgi:hypothetical protein
VFGSSGVNRTGCIDVDGRAVDQYRTSIGGSGYAIAQEYLAHIRTYRQHGDDEVDAACCILDR